MPTDPLPPDADRPRPLRIEGVAETRLHGADVRHPRGREAEAAAAAGVLELVAPVVERYLGAPLEGRLRLDLLDEARVGGANPATGVVRHALLGFSERSPRTAGLLSYQLGRILWYRSTGEGEWDGPPPRVPDWLLEAALLPLLHVWHDRAAWVDHLSEQVRLLAWHRPLGESELVSMERLAPRRRRLAVAQALLRGQALMRLEPDWVRALRSRLGEDPTLDGDAALASLCSASPADLREVFARELAEWVATAEEDGRGRPRR